MYPRVGTFKNHLRRAGRVVVDMGEYAAFETPDVAGACDLGTP